MTSTKRMKGLNEGQEGAGGKKVETPKSPVLQVPTDGPASVVSLVSVLACENIAEPKTESGYRMGSHHFCPLLGILFKFVLFISLGWPSLQGGAPPP